MRLCSRPAVRSGQAFFRIVAAARFFGFLLGLFAFFIASQIVLIN